MQPKGRVQVSLSVALINKSICQRVRSCVRTAVLEEQPTRNKASECHLPVVCKWAEHKQHTHLHSDSKPKSRPGIPRGAVAPMPALWPSVFPRLPAPEESDGELLLSGGLGCGSLSCAARVCPPRFLCCCL